MTAVSRTGRLLVVAVVVAATVPTLLAPPALACSCVSIEDRALGAVTSFEGRLVDRQGDRLTFSVDRRISGGPRPGDRVVVQTISGDESACGRSWSSFRRYQVVATGTDVLHSNFCHPTRTLGYTVPALQALSPVTVVGLATLTGIAAVTALTIVLRRHRRRARLPAQD